MYYRMPKEYLIPVVVGDIGEQYMKIKEIQLKKDLAEVMAFEEADKEFVESQIKGSSSEEDCF